MIATCGAYEWLVLVRFGQWTEMLREKPPAEKDLFLRAAAEQARMDALARDIPAWPILDLANVDLAARIAQSRNDNASELRYRPKAVKLEDALAYLEPPAWHHPTREPLGAALLRAGRAGEAEKVFRKDLEWNPRNGRSLHGLEKTLRVQEKKERLAFVDRELKNARQYADTNLP